MPLSQAPPRLGKSSSISVSQSSSRLLHCSNFTASARIVEIATWSSSELEAYRPSLTPATSGAPPAWATPSICASPGVAPNPMALVSMR
jgi:hypothetical protein